MHKSVAMRLASELTRTMSHFAWVRPSPAGKYEIVAEPTPKIGPRGRAFIIKTEAHARQLIAGA